MLKAQKLTLAVLISAAIISQLRQASKVRQKDLLKMRTVLFSSVQVTSAVTKNGVDDTSSFAQTAIVNIESGFTLVSLVSV